jgi:hypothetical protein
MSFRALIRASRHTASGMPWWVLPFYWASAAMVILFAGLIWPVAAFCTAMRPMYEAQHQRAICLFRSGAPGRD